MKIRVRAFCSLKIDQRRENSFASPLRIGLSRRIVHSVRERIVLVKGRVTSNRRRRVCSDKPRKNSPILARKKRNILVQKKSPIHPLEKSPLLARKKSLILARKKPPAQLPNPGTSL